MTEFKDVPKGRYFVSRGRPYLRINEGTGAFDLCAGYGLNFQPSAEVEVVTFRNLATRFGDKIDENLPFINTKSPAWRYRRAMIDAGPK